MKKKMFLAGMAAMALAFGMALVGCDNATNETPSPRTETLTFTGGSDSNATVVTLSRTVAASVLAAVSEGTWNYTITQAGVEISKGTVVVSAAELTFTSSAAGIEPFTATSDATANGTTTITFNDNGKIPKDSGGDATIPSLTGRTTLTAGSPVNVAATATTADVAFTGATGVTGLSAVDFIVTGGTFTSASVASDTATVVIGFLANAETTAKTITVAVNDAGSTKIKGGATVTITQAAFDPDPPETRTAGLYVGASTTATNVSTEAGDGLLAKSLSWLKTNAAAGTTYSILLDAGETLNPTALSSAQLHSANNLAIILKGLGTEHTVQLGATNGSLFTVDANVTLTLDGYLTLKGRSDNTASLVNVATGGILEMKGNSKITGNTLSSSNTDDGGGGVYVDGSFTMSGNAAISGNTAERGGGVRVDDGSFTMNGSATVSGNTASSSGGGMYLDNSGSFAMSGNATVSGNTASSSGGGVRLNEASTFTKTGGVIYGSNETNATLRNVVTGYSDKGAAINPDNSDHRRETTVSADQSLSASGYPRTYTGQWSD